MPLGSELMPSKTEINKSDRWFYLVSKIMIHPSIFSNNFVIPYLFAFCLSYMLLNFFNMKFRIGCAK